MSVTTGLRTPLRVAATSPWWAAPAALTLAIAAVLLAAPYPPLQDFSEWAYQGALLARLLGGLPVTEVSLVTHPVPNSLAQALLGVLAMLLPATLAAYTFLLALLGSGLALSLALGRRHRPASAGAFAVLLLVAFIGNTPFWNGYVNYQLALLLFGAWFLLPPARREDAGPILAFGLLIFLAHAAVFAAFCVLVAVRALAKRRLRGAALGLAPVGVLGVWYVLVGTAEPAEPAAGLDSLGAFLAYKAYTLSKLGPYHNFVFVEGGDEALRPALYWAGTAVNLLFVAGLFGALGFGLRRAWRRRSLDQAPLLAAALLVGLFLVLPRVAQHVINPGERLLIPAVLMLLLAVPLPGRAVRPLAALGGLALAANIAGFALPHGDWSVPVHFRTMEAMGGARALYRHRPTSFACKWAELERSVVTGEAPRLPISFRTSLLTTTAPPFDCPMPPAR
ncbi:MAG: hypothetical protein ACOYOH_08765 [Paracraurococcus sp.]